MTSIDTPARAGQPYPDYELDGSGSASRYRAVDTAEDLNYFALDRDLLASLQLHLDAGTLAWATPVLEELGAGCGGPVARRAEAYDAAGHELVRHDRFGRDVSRIAYHPDWLTNLDYVFDFGVAGWNHDPARRDRAPVPLLAAFDYLVGQADMALCCPLELAHGAVAVLERFGSERDREDLLGPITATTAAARQQVAQVATEITGGSDVGASRTEARRDGDGWRLDGEKWFASNIGAEQIVTLGRVDDVPGTAGLGLFIVPRTRSDGTPNGISIRRLKDKLGTIGVPTGELLLDDAEARLIGEPEHGWRYMAEMLNHTRFWNGVGSVGLMRRAFVEAASYAARRRSFGTTIDAFPMVAERLVWLHVDLAATTALMFHCAAALEDGADTRFRTLAPVLKYRAGEQNVEFARAAIETLGGNGYVADFPTPRLLRDAQVNTIWEGTSNICALDLLRAIERQQGDRHVLDDLDAQLDELAGGPLGDLVADARDRIAGLRRVVASLAAAPPQRQQQQARRLADHFGDCVALGALIREADLLARAGDWRRALAAALFHRRLVAAPRRIDAVQAADADVPDLYGPLFGEDPVDQAAYAGARRA